MQMGNCQDRNLPSEPETPDIMRSRGGVWAGGARASGLAIHVDEERPPCGACGVCTCPL